MSYFYIIYTVKELYQHYGSGNLASKYLNNSTQRLLEKIYFILLLPGTYSQSISSLNCAAFVKKLSVK